MLLFIGAMLAGAFSALAPCVLPLLPMIIAPSAGQRQRSVGWLFGGLAISIVIWSILLKATTLLIGVPVGVWAAMSGGVLVLVGMTLLWPSGWDRIMALSGLATKAQQRSAAAATRRGWLGDVLFGASLGPVFSVCSPTYGVIVAIILPSSPILGLVYLMAYVAGLLAVLALVAVSGQRMVRCLGWSLQPGGVFRRTMGAIVVLFGVMIMTGFDKTVSAWLVSQGWFDWQLTLEELWLSTFTR
ncbi:MAG: hypothetical protein Q4A37_00310 [Candidatus Saccharibacteria bacterium]|nr:hypothetical protein [Candidatus Saccharibacteria bacterium]